MTKIPEKFQENRHRIVEFCTNLRAQTEVQYRPKKVELVLVGFVGRGWDFCTNLRALTEVQCRPKKVGLVLVGFVGRGWDRDGTNNRNIQ